ncbi:MAG TPA: imidazole glycerol phosphate synthase subunit HisH [Longimicrobiales bacterium]
MNIAVIDYGTGNLHSLTKALEWGGANVWIERELNYAVRADALVLPGVGAFGAAAAQLAPAATALKQAIAQGLPCLGICLGMQLLFDSSDEGGGAGMSIIGGHVRRLCSRRVPHIGWNTVDMVDDALFHGIPQLVAYFANSYVVEPADESDVIGWCSYGRERFPAAVRRDNVWGVQFHPEKSGPEGLHLLGNFIAQVHR